MANPIPVQARKRGRDEDLLAVVNLGFRTKVHSMVPPASKVKYVVPMGAVVLAPRGMAEGLARAPLMRGAEGEESGSTDYSHPWAWLRWWELGLEVADGAGLDEIKDRRARTAEALRRPIDRARFAEYFDKVRPSAEWDLCWEPRGVPTITTRLAQEFSKTWTDGRFIRAYARTLANEGQARNAGKPFVQDPQALRDFCENRVQHILRERRRGSGVAEPRDPFGPGSRRGGRLAAPLHPR